MLIGLNGKLRSGKDEVYSIIKELRPDAEKVSFAAKIKESAAATLGIDVVTLENLKNDETIFYEALTPKLKNPPHTKPFTVREYLQRYGDEAHRKIFGDTFWLDQALPDSLNHETKFLVVTDMRFANEVERVIELGGFTVRVNRFRETAHGDHASEQNIDEAYIDWELDNTGTIKDLKKNVKEMLEAFEEC